MWVPVDHKSILTGLLGAIRYKTSSIERKSFERIPSASVATFEAELDAARRNGRSMIHPNESHPGPVSHPTRPKPSHVRVRSIILLCFPTHPTIVTNHVFSRSIPSLIPFYPIPSGGEGGVERGESGVAGSHGRDGKRHGPHAGCRSRPVTSRGKQAKNISMSIYFLDTSVVSRHLEVAHQY